MKNETGELIEEFLSDSRKCICGRATLTYWVETFTQHSKVFPAFDPLVLKQIDENPERLIHKEGWKEFNDRVSQVRGRCSDDDCEGIVFKVEQL